MIKTDKFARKMLRIAILGFWIAAEYNVPAVAEDVAPSSVAGGPPIPGVCVLSREAVFDASKVGQDVTGQFRSARDAAQKDVHDQEVKIAADIKALEGEKTALSEHQHNLRQQELVLRLKDLRAEAAKKSQDLETARQEAVKKIAAKAQPFIADVYQRYRCSLLLSRDAVLAGNPGMDVTAEVIKGLDGAVTQMSFDLDKHS